MMRGPMKRFYEQAEVAEHPEGFAVTLDGRPVMSPARTRLVVPSRILAEAIADEWAAQEETIQPQEMMMTRLAATAADRVSPARPEVVATVAGYAASDLVCYRAEAPAELVARQEAVWQPLLDWLAKAHGAALVVTEGVIPVAQPEAALAACRRAVEAHDDHALAALATATEATGSLVIALALSARRLDAAGAWEASQVDETWQSEQWGGDHEAAERRAAIRADIEHSARFLDLLRR